ncbi:MAG: putative metal-dependent hydrolase [Anaerolineae bacterium]
MGTDAPRRAMMIEQIRSLPARLEAAVSGLTDAQRTTRYLEGEWTVAQIVHHIADSHLNAFIRLKLILTEDRPTLKPYDQEAWAETAEAVSPTLEGSLALIRGLHQRWVALLESLDDADWQRAALHPESGAITADDILATYSRHGETHLAQIAKVLAAGG